MTEKPTMPRRRWYDNIGELAIAVHVSRQLSPEIQALIARSLNDAINEHRQHRRNARNVTSLGQGRVMGLYQAAQNRRWYDPKPDLHRAFSLMTTVPEGFLHEFANRILQVGRAQQVSPPALGDRRAQPPRRDLQHDVIRLEDGQHGFKLVSGWSDGPQPPSDPPHHKRQPR